LRQKAHRFKPKSGVPIRKSVMKRSLTTQAFWWRTSFNRRTLTASTTEQPRTWMSRSSATTFLRGNGSRLNLAKRVGLITIAACDTFPFQRLLVW
jgi:hypothetical protein